MRCLIIILAILFFTFMFVDVFAQEMPLVYDVENTCAACEDPYMPTMEELPVIENLPDPHEWSDGRGTIENYSDWQYRRAEIAAEIEHYEIGLKPDRPDSITASYSNGTLTVNVTVGEFKLTLTSNINLPEGEGPFPAIIGINSPTGSLPSDIFSSRNIVGIPYSHNQVTTYGNPQLSDPYYQLYPEQNLDNAGQYSAWAWGVSRIIDGLELVQGDLPIDLKHLAVNGCSYAGKLALFAGAYDERIALTIAQESGGGGAPAWRVSETLGDVEKLGATDSRWFREDMFQFRNDNVSKLPHDHHELLTMCLPRALLVTGNTNYTWLANPSCYVSARAAQKVYETFGIGDRFGFYVDGGHNHCAIPSSQRPAIEAFVDKFLLGDTTANTEIRVHPYATTDLAPWITWDNPELSNGTSFFEKASLIYPENDQIQLDTSLTLMWNSLESAEKYFLQLSLDPLFETLFMSDSTTDTVRTLTELSPGTRYYWRLRARNTEGSTGPYSDRWNFATNIPFSGVPQLVSAIQYEDNRTSVLATWRPVQYASEYTVEASVTTSFVNKKSATTADTFAVLTGIGERKYYYRIRSKNVSGPSDWSELSEFVILNTPTNLVAQSSGPNEITVVWDDNSNQEDGYIIERKQSPQSTFTVIDTVEKSVKLYIDKDVGQDFSIYEYRVKAFQGTIESAYSNEANVIPAGIKEDNKIPAEYSISQNYPNPFNPVTKIEFSLIKKAPTKLVIYDLLGREIRTLINKELEAGVHSINFNAVRLPSGVYLYRLQSGDFSQVKKMVLLK